VDTTIEAVINLRRANGGIETPMLCRLNEYAPEEHQKGKTNWPLPGSDKATHPIRRLPRAIPVILR